MGQGPPAIVICTGRAQGAPWALGRIWRLGRFYRGLAVFCLFPAMASIAASGPRLPCGVEPVPAYALAGQPAQVALWRAEDLSGEWVPPKCARWRVREFTALVAVSGRLRGAPDSSVFLRRIAAISRSKAILYWSYSRKTWRTLFAEAHALAGPDADLKRDDFRLDELAEGRDLYNWQKEDAPVSGSIIRMRFHDVSPEQIVLARENVNATRLLFIKLLGKGDYETILMLSRHKGDVWNYFHLVRYGDGSRPLWEDERASLINRAVAAFRYLGGLPMDREPPAAP